MNITLKEFFRHFSLGTCFSKDREYDGGRPLATKKIAGLITQEIKTPEEPVNLNFISGWSSGRTLGPVIGLTGLAAEGSEACYESEHKDNRDEPLKWAGITINKEEWLEFQLQQKNKTSENLIKKIPTTMNENQENTSVTKSIEALGPATGLVDVESELRRQIGSLEDKVLSLVSKIAPVLKSTEVQPTDLPVRFAGLKTKLSTDLVTDVQKVSGLNSLVDMMVRNVEI